MNIAGKRIRIINRKRFTLSLLLLSVILISTVMLTFNVVSGKEEIIYRDYIVDEGDTIWEIADNSIGEDREIREVIYQIEKINGIKGQHIYPGQRIKIPIQNR